MRILCHGAPFCCDYTLLDVYRGKHDIRWIGIDPRARYLFDPIKESANSVLNRIRNEWSPDLLLCWTPEIYPPPMGIEDIDLPTAALVSDWHLNYPVFENNLGRFDVVLCDKPGVHVLSSPEINAHHVTPLYSQISTLHHPIPLQRDIDLLYLGSLNPAAHPKRAKLLHRISQLSDEYRVGIASGIVQEAYAHLLNRARIVFNHSVRGELNLRVFETLACGAVPFLEEDNEEARAWFTDGKDVVFYNEATLEEKIRGLLSDPPRWMQIAHQGQERASTLSGENRFDALIDWIAAQPRGSRPFKNLSAAERRYQDLLLYGFSRWNAYLPLRQAYATKLIQESPQEPRFWTLLGRALLPGPEIPDQPETRLAALKPFVQAHRLNKASAPYALNLATVARSFDMDEQESAGLQATLSADSLEGSTCLVGNPACPFWNRWMRTVAEKTVSLNSIHAEAHIRFATILARHGQLDLAQEHLETARRKDPANYSGIRLTAEILWATGHHSEGTQYLNRYRNEFPLDIAYRERLLEMLESPSDPAYMEIREEIRRLKQALSLPRSLLGQ